MDEELEALDEPRTLGEFLEALGSSAPAPGGGAASALAGALAAALAEMVAQLTAGRPKYAAVEERVRAILAASREQRTEMIHLMAEDERAYSTVAAAYRLPRTTDEERAARDQATQRALVAAMQPPLAMMECGCRILELAGQIAEIGNPTVASDAGCAALLGEAAVRAAALNVFANVVLLRDPQEADRARTRVAELKERARDLCEQTMATVRERMGA